MKATKESITYRPVNTVYIYLRFADIDHKKDLKASKKRTHFLIFYEDYYKKLICKKETQINKNLREIITCQSHDMVVKKRQELRRLMVQLEGIMQKREIHEKMFMSLVSVN